MNETDWEQIITLCDQWVAIAPTPVVRLNRAIAIAEAQGCPCQGHLHTVRSIGDQRPGQLARVRSVAGGVRWPGLGPLYPAHTAPDAQPLPRISNEWSTMLALGLVLLLLDMLLLQTGILSTIGWILIVVGLILLILGALDRGVGPRRYYW